MRRPDSPSRRTDSSSSALSRTASRPCIETLRRQPDIVLLDVGLPDMTGFEAASRLRDAASSAAIVLASSRERSDFGPLIVDSGANGFVQKEQLSGEMIRTEIAA